MKRKVVELFIVIMCMFPCIGVHAEETKTVVVTGDNVRLRSNSSFEGDVVCEVKYGTELEKTGTYSEWDEVVYNGKKLFIHSQYTEEKENVEIPVTETIQNYKYYGQRRITAYCHCRKCTGTDGVGHTSSGTVPTAGRTVANNVLRPGTRVMIRDHIYIVEDTGGAVGNSFDVYYDTHEEALNSGFGGYWDVWIVE